MYGPTQNNDGTWRIKANEELEILIKKIASIIFNFDNNVIRLITCLVESRVH